MSKESHQSIYRSNTDAIRINFNNNFVSTWFECLFAWFFGINNSYKDYDSFLKMQTDLKEKLIQFLVNIDFRKEECVDSFFNEIPEIQGLLLADLDTILEYDPAAVSKNEILFSYPGFFAISAYRIANAFYRQEIPLLPRMITEYAHSKTGIDIHPGATIGNNFYIDHGTGIVIGQTAQIGKNVRIYQGVTLGALSVSKSKAAEKRHPTIEDDVILYANATVLGGATVIGKGSVIGGNVWITSSVPAESVVVNKNNIIIKSKQLHPEAINFII